MIDDHKQYIFVENPKTATYSVKHALMGEENVHNPLDPRMATVNHDTPAVIESKHPEKWRTYTKFVVVRNTWDRAHSFFEFYRTVAASRNYQALGFDGWVTAGCPPPEESHLTARMHGEGRFDDVLCQLRYVRGVDEIIVLGSLDAGERRRELQAGIDRVAARLNITVPPVPGDKNDQGRATRAIVWQRETVERLGARYAAEVERFGFQEPSIG